MKRTQIFIAFNDRHGQARLYHSLGMVAQEQRQWEQAQGYYERALEITIAFNDRYYQAITYHRTAGLARAGLLASRHEESPF